jgi:ABC-type xylose transport system permease subunit
MLITFVFGLIVVELYNVWTWNVWLLVTLSGWAMILKGLYYFLAPGSWIKSMMKWAQNMTLLYIGSIVCLILGLVLGYYTFFAV